MVAAQTGAGSMYISFGTQPPGFLNYNNFFDSNGSFFYGSEWVTGITINGDDRDYWDKDDVERYKKP